MTWVRNDDHSTDIHSRLSRKNDNFIQFGNSIPVVNETLYSPTTIRDFPERMINSVPFIFHPSRKRYISVVRSRHQECTSQGAPTYPYFFKPLKIYISVPPVPFWSCLHQKNTTSFSDLQGCLIWTRKHTSKLPGEKGYANHPERILDDTFSTIHGFSTLAANMYRLPSTASPPWPQTINLK